MEAALHTKQVKIIQVSETRVAVFEHRGDPRLISNSVRMFIAWRKQNNLTPNVSATFNILYNNPAEVAANEYRLDICAAIEQDIALNNSAVVCKVIPAGRCAVLRHIGSDDGLDETLKNLYTEWLPKSGEKLRDFPLYLQRVVFFPEVAESEAITDVFLPIC